MRMFKVSVWPVFVTTVAMLFVAPVQAQEAKAAKPDEASLKVQLQDVIKQLDPLDRQVRSNKLGQPAEVRAAASDHAAASKKYYEVVDAAMINIDPTAANLIAKRDKLNTDLSATPGDAKLKTQLEDVNKELVPLWSQVAGKNGPDDVKVARKNMDTALEKYYQAVEAAMIKLDPKAADLIAKKKRLAEDLSALQKAGTAEKLK